MHAICSTLRGGCDSGPPATAVYTLKLLNPQIVPDGSSVGVGSYRSWGAGGTAVWMGERRLVL